MVSTHHLKRTVRIGALLTMSMITGPMTQPAQPRADAPSMVNAAWSSTYLQPTEFASKGNGAVKVQRRMVIALDRVRSALGRPIYNLSGYRDPIHNARVGGARRSRHLVGDAVDIDLRPYDTWTRYVLAWHLIDNGFTSFGTYGDRPHMLHADMGPRAAVWHHSGGRRPDWLKKALREWHWRPVTGSPHR
ncbi:MAG: D-Ala-D-Ala carboxypeptidase family metallohydrolase [Pseudomonadota bacterium]